MYELRNVEVTLGQNFVHLTFDPEQRNVVKGVLRDADLKEVQLFRRSAWWSFEPTDLEDVKERLRRSGFPIKVQPMFEGFIG